MKPISNEKRTLLIVAKQRGERKDVIAEMLGNQQEFCG
jgi:hypothetical protein